MLIAFIAAGVLVVATITTAVCLVLKNKNRQRERVDTVRSKRLASHLIIDIHRIHSYIDRLHVHITAKFN